MRMTKRRSLQINKLLRVHPKLTEDKEKPTAVWLKKAQKEGFDAVIRVNSAWTLLIYALLCLNTGCLARRHNMAATRSVTETSTTFQVDGQEYVRHIVLVRGLRLVNGADTFSRDPRAETHHIRWIPFGMPHNERKNIEYVASNGRVNTAATEVFHPESIRQQAARQPTGQLPFMYEATDTNGKKKWYVPLGSHAIYFVGCVFPRFASQSETGRASKQQGKDQRSLGESDPVIETTLGPVGTSLGNVHINLPLSQVRWIWELFPGYSIGKTPSYGLDLRTRNNNYQNFLNRDIELAKGGQGNCALLSNTATQDFNGNVAGLQIESPALFEGLENTQSSYLALTREESLRRRTTAYLRENLIPAVLASLALLSAVQTPDIVNEHWLESLGLSSTFASYLFKRIGVAPLASRLWRKVVEAQPIKKAEDATHSVKQQLDELATTHEKKDQARNMLLAYRSIFFEEQGQEVEISYRVRRQAAVEILLSRILTLAQELGERHFHSFLLRWQRESTNPFPKEVGTITPFDLELVQMEPALIRKMVTNSASAEALISRQQAVQSAILQIFKDYPYEALLRLQETLLQVFNSLDFDFGNPADVLELMGDHPSWNRELWQTFRREISNDYNAVANQFVKFVSPTLFEIFMEWKFTAQDVVAAALPHVVNDIFAASNERGLRAKWDLNASEAKTRTEQLARAMGLQTINTSVDYLSLAKYNPFQIFADGLLPEAVLRVPFALEGKDIKQELKKLQEIYESERVFFETIDPLVVLDWVKTCTTSGQNNPYLCFGGLQAPDDQALILRLQSVANLFLQSYLSAQSLEGNNQDANFDAEPYRGAGKKIFAMCTQITQEPSLCRWNRMKGFQQMWEQCESHWPEAADQIQTQESRTEALAQCLGLGNASEAKNRISELNTTLLRVLEFGYYDDADSTWLARFAQATAQTQR